MPFGLGSRACPAQRFVRDCIKALTVAVLRQVHLDIPENLHLRRGLRLGLPTVFSSYEADSNASLRASKAKLLARLERQQRRLVEELGEQIGKWSLRGMIRMGYNNAVMGENFFTR